MPANVWLLNLIVFGVLMESDLGRRKIGWFRVLRPLLTTVLIVPLFLDSIPANGHNVVLQVVGAAVGVLLGLAAHLFVSVYFDPTKTTKSRLAGRGTGGQGTGGQGTGGRPYSRAGFGYTAFWAVIFGARLLFIYGTIHWFPASLGQFLASHQLSGAGLTNALIFMAITMALARSALLGVRARTATRAAADTVAAPVISSIR
ncbi:MAG TPA: hypothetical protein VGM53_00550 [Streptosporangiaceae bacterium]|jgi:hypothetical protein